MLYGTKEIGDKQCHRFHIRSKVKNQKEIKTVEKQEGRSIKEDDRQKARRDDSEKKMPQIKRVGKVKMNRGRTVGRL